MLNPKDTLEQIVCEKCGVSIFLNMIDAHLEIECSARKSKIHHYPGCHKVHLACANQCIDEARDLLDGNRTYYDTSRGMVDNEDVLKWLDRWRTDE